MNKVFYRTPIDPDNVVELQLQIFNRHTGRYEQFDLGGPDNPTRDEAQVVAAGRPWRICNPARPLKPIYGFRRSPDGSRFYSEKNRGGMS